MSTVELRLPQETVLYKLSVNMQLFGKHEQTDLLEDTGDCFIFLSFILLFSSVSALEFQTIWMRLVCSSENLLLILQASEFHFTYLFLSIFWRPG